jgi:hypothetical protein
MSAAAVAGQAALAAALLDPQAPCPPGLRVWNGSDPVARLAVHRNNVVASLVDALADSFPVCQAWVGEDFFRAMAARFVRQQPPRSRVLAHYGAGLPAFIEGFEPAREVPALADLARLEWARQRACHAADAPVLDAAAVQQALAGGEAVAALRLVCHPSVAVLASRWAIVSLWAAHQCDSEAGQDAALAALDPTQAESALVLRVDDEVRVLRLAPGSDHFVAALLEGAALAEAAGRALQASADFDLTQALRLLRQQGALSALQTPLEDSR